MKGLIEFLRYVVGILFIFSGLVKANDPMGLAYKMEEFFELWKWFWFIPYAKVFAVSMNALEIVSGFALCIGWKTKWNLRLLLSLIVFFTGLTGYTYFTGYPKTCGCFGDCLPIRAATSFYKDIFLLITIVFLVIYQNKLSALKKGLSNFLVLVVFLMAVGLEYYVLHHLPIIDCLPYQAGINIPEARKQPPRPPGSITMFVYQKAGVEIEFPADQFPADFSAENYQFVRRYDTGTIPEPKIQGFALTTPSGKDSTDAVLEMEQVYLLVSEEIGAGPDKWGAGWKNLTEASSQKRIPIYFITNQIMGWKQIWSVNYPMVSLLSSDRTPIRTMARVDPTVYALKKGTIINKWALIDFPRRGDGLVKQIPATN
ncbi:MAG: DoxX family protein [Bacteroidetes bacterium]|nr:DoxX family protein [Bacteroidota bacterium]